VLQLQAEKDVDKVRAVLFVCLFVCVGGGGGVDCLNAFVF
jgi:hypothetical protein